MTIAHPFWEGLASDHLDVARRLLVPMHLPAGAVLFRQGELAQHTYFVTTGSLDVSVRLPGGGTSHLTSLGAGNVLGELSLASTEHRRTATVVAATDTEVLAMHRSDLYGLCAQYHPAALELTGRMARHVLAALRRVTAERLALGAAPCIAERPESTGDPGSPFDAFAVLGRTPFCSKMSDDERRRLVDLGVLRTHARAVFVRARADAFELVVRGSTEVVAGASDGILRRLRVVGPGQCACADDSASKSFIRNGATVLALGKDARGVLTDPDHRISYRFQEARLVDLMGHLERDTRALARERRQVQQRGGEQ